MPSSRRSVKARRATPELPRSRCNDTLPRPSRWIRPAEWKRAESSAIRSQPRAGAMEASSSRTSVDNDITRGRLRAGDRGGASPLCGADRSQANSLEREQPPLEPHAARAVAPDPVGRDDTVAGDEQPEPILCADRARRARGPRPARQRGELAVGHDLAARYRPQRVDDCSLEGRSPVEVERDARRIDGLTG